MLLSIIGYIRQYQNTCTFDIQFSCIGRPDKKLTSVVVLVLVMCLNQKEYCASCCLSLTALCSLLFGHLVLNTERTTFN